MFYATACQQQLYLRDNVGGRWQRDQIKGAAAASSHVDISSCAVASFKSSVYTNDIR